MRLFKSSFMWLAVMPALVSARPARAATFSCGAGNLACLVNAINASNANGQANTVTLAAGSYTITRANNTSDDDGGNGLPVVTGQIVIKSSGATIKRPLTAPHFRFFL